MLWITVPKTASLWVTRRVRSFFLVTGKLSRESGEFSHSFQHIWHFTDIIYAITYSPWTQTQAPVYLPAVCIWPTSAHYGWMLSALSPQVYLDTCLITPCKLLHSPYPILPSWCIFEFSGLLPPSLYNHILQLHLYVASVAISLHTTNPTRLLPAVNPEDHMYMYLYID